MARQLHKMDQSALSAAAQMKANDFDLLLLLMNPMIVAICQKLMWFQQHLQQAIAQMGLNFAQ